MMRQPMHSVNRAQYNINTSSTLIHENTPHVFVVSTSMSILLNITSIFQSIILYFTSKHTQMCFDGAIRVNRNFTR